MFRPGLSRSSRTGRADSAPRRWAVQAASGNSWSARWRSFQAVAALAAMLPLTAAFTAPRLVAAPPAPATARPTAHLTPGGPVVRTRDGQLQGTYAEGVDEFLGIPYAAPPVGELRWRAPQPATRGTGVARGDDPAAACPQLEHSNGPARRPRTACT